MGVCQIRRTRGDLSRLCGLTKEPLIFESKMAENDVLAGQNGNLASLAQFFCPGK